MSKISKVALVCMFGAFLVACAQQQAPEPVVVTEPVVEPEPTFSKF